jgi:hypothetical protein
MLLGQQNPVTCSKRAVGVFPTRWAVHQALDELEDAGFPLSQVSVIVRDIPPQKTATEPSNSGKANSPLEKLHYQLENYSESRTGEGVTVGALSGGALGGLTGLLIGLGTLAIPGVGPVMLAGGAATAIATTLAGSAIGAAAGSLLGALVGLGISEEQAVIYNERIAQGEYLIIVDCKPEETPLVEAILHHQSIEEYHVFDIPGETNESSSTTNHTTTYNSTTTPISTYSPTPSLVTSKSTGIDVGRSKYAIGIFSNHRDAESAVNDLRLAAFPLDQVSLVAHNLLYPEFFVGVVLRDRLDAMRLGMSAERARFYHDRLMNGDYVMMVNGTESEIRHAATILNNRGIQELQMYDPTAIASALPVHLPNTADPTPTTQQSEIKTGLVSPNPAPLEKPISATTAPADFTLPSPSTSEIGHVLINQKQVAIGLCQHCQMLEALLSSLQQADFPMDRVSVIAKAVDQQQSPTSVSLRTDKTTLRRKRVSDRSKTQETDETILSSFSHFLIGVGTFAIPGIGSVLVGGATATALVAMALANGAISTAITGLATVFASLGIPQDQAKAFHDRLLQGDYLILLEGHENELRRAELIFRQAGGQSWGIYDVSSEPETFQADEKTIHHHEGSAIKHDQTSSVSSVSIRLPQVTVIDHRSDNN